MKLLHLGDLHLGRTLGDFSLIEDQRDILNKICRIAEEKEADAVCIAGDIYDRAIPSEAAVNLLDDFMNSLAEKKIACYMISGNHDSDDRLNFASRLLSSKDIYIAAKYQGKLQKEVFRDEYGEVNIYLLPYIKASLVRYYFPEEKIESYEDAIRVILERAEINPKERNIILAHQFVAGKGGDPELAGSEGIGNLNVGQVEKIRYDCFDAFDYAALGHIHSPQKVEREEVRYCGSPLKYSLSEVNNKKSLPLVTLQEKGKLEIELLPLKPMRDLRHLKGKREKLLAAENIVDRDDFIYITLTDEEFINDAMGIFQQYYPNTVKIDYENSHTKELQDLDLTEIAEERPLEEILSNFYEQVYGTKISEEEKGLLMEAAAEAGVIDEAD
jgi:DNA repair protein SbcD/Mre11